ncbi:MAG: hypothetical protein FRX48_03859 [Lasallia pustulata]|uniref:Uncharacterized protein n=1 Tax=Lasallia pustulata TaxID=136370 RepID=A0A5M8PTF0_9LECA|nr:MAG: hypothetical protein FRX48_03859 [Lasallia pustulata]
MATGQSSSKRRKRRRPTVEENPLIPSDDDDEPNRPYYKYLFMDYNKFSADSPGEIIIAAKLIKELSTNLAMPEEDRKAAHQIIQEALQCVKNRRKIRRPKGEEGPLVPSDADYKPNCLYHKHLINDYNQISTDSPGQTIIASKLSKELSNADLNMAEDDRKAAQEIIHEALRIFMTSVQPRKYSVDDILDAQLLLELAYSTEQAEAELANPGEVLGAEGPPESDRGSGKGKQKAEGT